MGLPKFNGEFRPDLKQDIGVYDAFMVHYMKSNIFITFSY